jgi:SAM-dependent methyltransferase
LDETIFETQDILRMLDSFLRDEGQWWDRFYADREKDIPFFVNSPDENLVSYFKSGQMKPGKVLELGCGPGRNAIYLAQQGCEVDAVDVSAEAIRWATERAEQAGLNINFRCQSIFDFDVQTASYDIVCDGGCLHHIPPHRRMDYVDLVQKALKPTGKFSLICFAPEGGSDLSDWEVYRQGSLRGGLGYTEERLRKVLEGSFEILEFRRMKEMGRTSQMFGKGFCWTVLMRPLSQVNP